MNDRCRDVESAARPTAAITRRRATAGLLSSSLLGALAQPFRVGAAEEAQPQTRPVILLALSTKGDLLEYSTQQLTCPAGSRVRVSFTNTTKYVHFDHNWVLLRPGSYDAVLAAAEQAGEANGWLPKHHPGIIAATPQAHRGQTVSTEFDAPPAGRYPYICSTPGHASSMWGVLTVTTR